MSTESLASAQKPQGNSHKQDAPNLLSKWMDWDVGIIPVPIYVVLCAVMIGFIAIDKFPSEMAMAMGVMAVFAFTLGELGNRLPVIRDIGAGAVLVTFIPSYLNYHHVIPEPMVKVVGDFFKSTNVLSLFIAAVIVGSILSMDRRVLVRGFIKIFVPIAFGSVMGAVVGVGVGAMVGLNPFDVLFYIVVPIMGGGVGEGAIPLTIGYSSILGVPQGELLARVLPAILVGNLTAILAAGSLNYLGKRKPHLTGEGRLVKGQEEDLPTTLEGESAAFNVKDVAAAGVTAVTLYLCGLLCFHLFKFPAPVVMLFLAVLLKLSQVVTPRLQAGSYTIYKLCLTAVAFPMLFAFGLVLTPWDKLVAGFNPANLITIVATVLGLVAAGFYSAKWVHLHPIDTAIIAGTHSGMGGAGDIAILSASNRMRLMPFAQIATRIGGGITISLALVAMALLK